MTPKLPQHDLVVDLCLFQTEIAEADGISREPSPPLRQLFETFAATTGWELHQFETAESIRSRAADPARQPVGEIRIVDLSADWPPGKPAVHRQRCDELAAAISAMANRPLNF